MKWPHDIALASDRGQVMVHTADCPDVRAAAARGEPVCTLFGIDTKKADKLPLNVKRHSCLDEL